MVDASLRPRPTFSTFLQSDTNVGGDGLTYYDYQRLLRSKKVSLLQEKRIKSYVPGYKKVVVPTTRRILPSGNYKQIGSSTDTVNEVDTTELQQKQITNRIGNMPQVNSKEQGIHAQTERLPSILKPHRLVKSAKVRSKHHSWSGAGLPVMEFQRPKTACNTKEAEIQVSQLRQQNQSGTSEVNEVDTPDHIPAKADVIVSEQKPRLLSDPYQPRAHTEVFCIEDEEEQNNNINMAARDALASTFIWSTTTQRANEAVGWAERVPPPIPVQHTTVEQFPDPVSQRLTFRRYHSEPAGWQAYGTEWDYIQTRTGGFVRGPQAMNYCSMNRQNQQIPGYLGFIPDTGTAEDPFVDFNPALLIRSLKPKPTSISRRSNIPGYTGHVHLTRVSAAHSDMSKPEPTTTARVHRHIPLEDDPSPFRKNGLFSKMITTVSPHNPYNKIEK